jgi:hypothetical protein
VVLAGKEVANACWSQKCPLNSLVGTNLGIMCRPAEKGMAGVGGARGSQGWGTDVGGI